MLLDLTPLRRHRDYRRLFVGQFVSAFGSFITYVALPVQVFELTRSSATVGLLGIVQLLPLAATALWGGALADVTDRRRLLLVCETLLLGASLTLALNAMQPQPSVVLLFAVAGLMSAITGFHSPALESLTPRLVERDDLHAVSALSSVRGTIAAIAGPALAGVCIATLGVPSTFGFDALTYAVSLLALLGIRSIPVATGGKPPGLSAIREAFVYAVSRPELTVPTW